MKTSYTSRVRAIDKSKHTIISIMRFTPKYMGGILEYKKVAPPRHILKYDWEDYEVEFKAQLKKLDPKKVYEEILQLSPTKEPVLVCCEKSNEFCHRRLVAEWLSEALDISVEEYEEEPEQCSLGV